MDRHGLSERPLPGRRFGIAKSAERGRVNWLTFIGQSFSTRSRIKATMPYESACVNWRMNDAGSAIAVWVYFWPEKGLR